MVKELTAYQADDGSIFKTELEAAQHDAVMALGKMDVFNRASALAIVKQAETILPILERVVKAQPCKVEADHALTN